MKFYSVLKFDILPLTSCCKSPLRWTSNTAVEPTVSIQRELINERKKMQFFRPILNIEKFRGMNRICSIITAINHVGWANISLPDLTVLHWNAYPLPPNIIKMKEELTDIELVNAIKQSIPKSDLYVMEKQTKWSLPLNQIFLKAMLVLLLSISEDGTCKKKVIFQRASVLNNAHELLIGFERKSAKPIVKNIFFTTKSESVCNNEPYWYSKVIVPAEFQNFFSNSKIEKQECLSLALLLVLSFLNVNYFYHLKGFQCLTNSLKI